MTEWWDSDQLAALQQASDEFDHLEVERLSVLFVHHIRTQPEPITLQTGLAVLKLLQRKRYINLVQDVAEALLAHGLDTVQLRHRYALALVDHDRTTAAEALLAALPDEVRSTDTEVLGAVGRVHKQRYATSGLAAAADRAADLAAAIEAYSVAYRSDPRGNYYHGINTAALLTRAAADGVILPGHRDPATEAAEIATAVLTGVASEETPGVWECATAAEACLVLGRSDDAVVWLARYLGSRADAFEYASTLRQFQQIWRLDTHSEPGRRLIPMLRNRLLQTEGGVLSVAPGEYTPESLLRFDAVKQTLERRGGVQYERVFGWDQFQPVGWLRDALVACRSVARIEDDYNNGWGTGFVLAGNQLQPDWPARVLLTNAHVVPDAVELDDVRIAFRGLSDAGPAAEVIVRPVGNILWRSPKHDLDACVLALPKDLSPQVAPLHVRKTFPELGAGRRIRAYVIGHPLGSPQVQLSLHNSLVLDVDDRYVWYRSPTRSGSSGSPVFDQRWRVIALHHGWSDSLPGTTGVGSAANEGIRLDRVVKELSAGIRPDLSGTAGG